MTKDEAELLKLVQENVKRCDKYLDDHTPPRDEASEVIELAKDALQSVARALTMKKPASGAGAGRPMGRR